MDLVRLQTEERAYVAEVTESSLEFALTFRYINLSGQVAYLHGCHPPAPPSIDKRIDGEWIRVYSPIVPECLSPPARVEPEASLWQDVTVIAGLPGQDIGPEWGTEEIVGTYRLRWGVEERGQHLVVFSNSFTLSTRLAE